MVNFYGVGWGMEWLDGIKIVIFFFNGIMGLCEIVFFLVVFDMLLLLFLGCVFFWGLLGWGGMLNLWMCFFVLLLWVVMILGFFGKNDMVGDWVLVVI